MNRVRSTNSVAIWLSSPILQMSLSCSMESTWKGCSFSSCWNSKSNDSLRSRCGQNVARVTYNNEIWIHALNGAVKSFLHGLVRRRVLEGKVLIALLVWLEKSHRKPWKTCMHTMICILMISSENSILTRLGRLRPVVVMGDDCMGGSAISCERNAWSVYSLVWIVQLSILD